MKQSIGAFPNISQIARYMGWGRDRTRAFVSDLPKFGTQYFYMDIVKKIKENME